MFTTPHTAPSGATPGSHLRLIWPEWQGAAAGMVGRLVPDIPLGAARRGYAVGTQILQAVLPPHDGPTATVPVPMGDAGLELRDGIESKTVLTRQLTDALKAIKDHEPARITTLGGTCAVSVAPFTSLADRYGEDLAVIWIDSHPDTDTGETDYDGYHAMAVSMITGHGDPEMTGLLPATVPAEHVALIGLHHWTEDAYQHINDWSLTSFHPDQLRASTQPLLRWLASTGCSRVALHLDVDAVDSDRGSLGLAQLPDGLTGAEIKRIAQDVQRTADVVGSTVAEFIPRDVLHIQQILRGYPLITAT